MSIIIVKEDLPQVVFLSLVYDMKKFLGALGDFQQSLVLLVLQLIVWRKRLIPSPCINLFICNSVDAGKIAKEELDVEVYTLFIINTI